MRSKLTLLAPPVDPPLSFESPPFSLRHQPQRPGELTELIDVPLNEAANNRVNELAAAVGLPIELILYIIIESTRVVDESIEALGLGPGDELLHALDAAGASVPSEPSLRHVVAQPLFNYAAAMERGLPTIDISGPPRARVPARIAATWIHAATAAGQPVDYWLAKAVDNARGDFISWEAAAARSGRTLAEWVLLQAARCARSRSTSPQTTASG